MKNGFKILIVSCLTVFLVAGVAAAGPFGVDITIPDLMGSGTGWAGSQEDQEVEPGDVGNQVWDLEGFFLDGTKLTMVGGFNFVNGVSGYTYDSGDIFIDVTGDAQYGPTNTGGGSGNTVVNNTFGYEYVLDMNFTDLTYGIYSLNNSSLVTVYFGVNDESNPWRYNAGGSYLGSGSIVYQSGLSDSTVGFLGGKHYAASVDLAFLGSDVDFISHFTMECGNDNLMGSGTTPVPEPATMMLLGTGLIGLAGMRRKRFIKK
jgi:hypothetical protein